MKPGTDKPATRRLFDSHCHIIDHRFPIVANQGYEPPDFPLADYLAQTRRLGVVAGAIVSGSFQANDQDHLVSFLQAKGHQGNLQGIRAVSAADDMGHVQVML
jgi:predicted TIM-barrel fold metal-dependent hydrolase